MLTHVSSPQTSLVADVIVDLGNAVANIEAVLALEDSNYAPTPERRLYRIRLTQSLRSLRIIRGGLVNLQAVLLDRVTP